MTGTGQEAVFAFLADPTTYGGAGPVTRIATHGAEIFLAGNDAYKVKRAVHFPFMDFSTLEKRAAACRAEIAVNRANAPSLYLGVVPITRSGGGLRLGGDDAVVEWAVHMRRFDETATLDRLAEQGPLGPSLVDRLAQAVLDAHQRAPVHPGEGATRSLGRVLRETVDELAAGTSSFGGDRIQRFGAALIAGFTAVEPLLRRRGTQGQIRHCHGDLHLGNLVLIEGEPVLFDALEFDPAFAVTDILYDLAFLVMDLCERGLGADANRLLNRYVLGAPDPVRTIDGLAALPVFLALRAAIRAKIAVLRWAEDAGQAKAACAYFTAAERFIAPASPLLVAIGGLSGSGKTSLAVRLAPIIGRAPGALLLRSDVERKRLAGVAETEPLPDTAYTPDSAGTVYCRLQQLAEHGLRAGQAVILDAVQGRPEEQAAAAALAAKLGVPFRGFWLEVPVEILKTRVASRRGDASDATPAVVERQLAAGLSAPGWMQLEAGQPVKVLAAAVMRSLAPA